MEECVSSEQSALEEDVAQLELALGSSQLSKASYEGNELDSLPAAVHVHDIVAVPPCDVKPSLKDYSETDSYTLEQLDDVMSSIAEGHIPASSEALLALNQAYQDVVHSFMDKLTLALTECREKQKTVQEKKDELDQSNSLVNKKYLIASQKFPIHIFGHPYFHDEHNMCPPMGAEAENKHREFDALIQFPRKWKPAEREKLIAGVKTCILEMIQKPLLSRKDILRSKQQQLDALIDVEKFNQISSDIEMINWEISNFRNMSNEKLFKIPEVEIDWLKIANHELLGYRSPLECELEWKNEANPAINGKEHWSNDEQERMLKLVKATHSEKDGSMWGKVALELGTGRTAFQCFQRFQTCVSPSTAKGVWSKEETKLMNDVVETCRIGDYIPWDQVAYYMEGRSRNQLCQHYNRYGLAKDNTFRRGRWTEEEDLRLMKAVKQFGARDWALIAKQVPQRTEGQCRERWTNCLDSSVTLGPWTPEEDMILRKGLDMFGLGRWAQVSQIVPGRTPQSCKTRWTILARPNFLALVVPGKRGPKPTGGMTYDQRFNKFGSHASAKVARRKHLMTLADAALANEGIKTSQMQPVKHRSLSVSAQAVNNLPDGIKGLVSTKLKEIHNDLAMRSIEACSSGSSQIRSVANEMRSVEQGIQRRLARYALSKLERDQWVTVRDSVYSRSLEMKQTTGNVETLLPPTCASLNSLNRILTQGKVLESARQALYDVTEPPVYSHLVNAHNQLLQRDNSARGGNPMHLAGYDAQTSQNLMTGGFFNSFFKSTSNRIAEDLVDCLRPNISTNSTFTNGESEKTNRFFGLNSVLDLKRQANSNDAHVLEKKPRLSSGQKEHLVNGSDAFGRNHPIKNEMCNGYDGKSSDDDEINGGLADDLPQHATALMLEDNNNNAESLGNRSLEEKSPSQGSSSPRKVTETEIIDLDDFSSDKRSFFHKCDIRVHTPKYLPSLKDFLSVMTDTDDRYRLLRQRFRSVFLWTFLVAKEGMKPVE